jgi:DNA repair exonuclease SbcCD ATPase subunit
MPRPPLGERAMTDVERQRKHRERKRAERAHDPNRSDRQKLADARKEIERLKQELAKAQAKPEQIAALRQHIKTVEQKLARRSDAKVAARRRA